MHKFRISLLLFLSISFWLSAQEEQKTFDVGIQVRPRAEFRNGQGTLIAEGQDPAFYVSNRARINLNYTSKRIIVGVAGQSVGVWGQQPQIESMGGFMLNEAWAKILLNQQWNITVGRQVLAYDGDRILGTLDWNVSGRFHDLVLVKYETPKFNAHLGVAYNANSETQTKPFYYATGQPYQHMELGWLSYLIAKPLKVNVLLLNTGYQSGVDTVPNSWTTSNLQTLGANVYFVKDRLSLQGTFYTQLGKNAQQQKVNAIMALFFAKLKLGQKSSVFLGFDYLSGNDMNVANGEQNAFNPLFGTNHKYYGYQDYFYVGNHLGNVGLMDIWGGINHSFTDRFSLRAAGHFFNSSGAIVDSNAVAQSSYLGTEIDLSFNFKIFPGANLQGGYSQMFASESMEYVKNVTLPKPIQNWAWLMINVDITAFKTSFN